MLPIPPSNPGWEEKNMTAGIVLLEGLHQPDKALPCFLVVLHPEKYHKSPLMTSSRFVVRHRCKAAYFAGRCYERMNDMAMANKYYEKAAASCHLFYGLIAQEKLGKFHASFYEPKPTPLSPKVRIFVMLLKQIHKNIKDCQAVVSLLMDDIVDHLETPYERHVVLQALRDCAPTLLPQYAKVLGFFSECPFKEAFPKISLVRDLDDPSLVHAIIYAESSFDQYMHGSADERGLMQVLPESGVDAAKTLGLKLDLKKLWEKDYNVMIGTQEFKNIFVRYKHYTP
jgi:soluble lytic murein transglycosylase